MTDYQFIHRMAILAVVLAAFLLVCAISLGLVLVVALVSIALGAAAVLAAL